MLSKEGSIEVWSLHSLEAADIARGWGLHCLGAVDSIGVGFMVTVAGDALQGTSKDGDNPPC